MSVPDATATLWNSAKDVASTEDARVRARAADCLALTLVEASVSSRKSEWAAAATGLASARGPAAVAGIRHGVDVTSAVLANGFLVHAGLADDSYRLAAHPGLPVVPSALAHAQEIRAPGPVLTDAVLAGYEVACALADLLLPRISQRGRRVTAAIAAPAAAAAAAVVRRLDDDEAVSALRLSMTTGGAPLHVVDAGGDGWRLQPALAAVAGISAVRAAEAGLVGPPEILEADNGLYASLCDDRWPGFPIAPSARILDVTFKQHGVAMYGQGIFDAVSRLPMLRGSVVEVSVRVHPFAARYGRQADSPGDSVASVEAIALRAFGHFHPEASMPSRVEVAADDGLDPLEAQVWVRTAIGDELGQRGTGDTRHWTSEDVETHAIRRLGHEAAALVRACRALDAGGPVEDVVSAWRRAT